MTSTYRFWVERQSPRGDWQRVSFAESNVAAYCHGYLDAMDGRYPSAPFRACKRMIDGTTKVLRETRGHGKVVVN